MSQYDGDGDINVIVLEKNEYDVTVKVRSLHHQMNKIPACLGLVEKIIEEAHGSGESYDPSRTTRKQDKYRNYDVKFQVLNVETISESGNSGNSAIDWDKVPTEDFRRVKAPKKKAYWDKPTPGPEIIMKIHVNHPIMIDHLKPEVQFTGYGNTVYKGNEALTELPGGKIITAAEDKAIIKKYNDQIKAKQALLQEFESGKKEIIQSILTVLNTIIPPEILEKTKHPDHKLLFRFNGENKLTFEGGNKYVTTFYNYAYTPEAIVELEKIGEQLKTKYKAVCTGIQLNTFGAIEGLSMEY